MKPKIRFYKSSEDESATVTIGKVKFYLKYIKYGKKTIAKFALPRLKWFKERHFDNPCDITFERWNEILDEMIFSFEYYAKDEWKLISDEEFKRVEEGMKLFGEYYGDLWW